MLIKIFFEFFQSGWEMPSEDSGHAIDLGGHDGIPSVGGLGGSD